MGRFPRPIFHVTVLFIEVLSDGAHVLCREASLTVVSRAQEAESIKRQLARGKADAAHNRLVETTGAGVMREIRCE